MKIRFAAAVAAACFAVPANAQTFEGVRAEIRGGYDHITIDGRLNADSGSEGQDGFAYGAELGYDARVGSNLLLGAYAGIDLANTKRCGEVYGLDRGCLKAGRSFTAGIRAGVQSGENVLFYAKGGYSNGRLKFSYRDFEDILDDVDAGLNRDGFHVGGGIEASVARRTYARLDYSFTNYNGSTFDFEGDEVRVDGSRHQLLFGVGMRF